MKSVSIKSLLAAAALVCSAGAASAADMLFSPAPATGWTITIGVEGRVMPEFEGSSDARVVAVPLFDIRRIGSPRLFRAPRDGFGIGLVEFNGLRIGPAAKIRLGRDQSDNPALAGLGDIDWTFEAGVFAEYWFTPWLRGRAEVRQGIGGHEGIVADLTADAVMPLSPQLTLSGGPRITLATSRAESPYFSITPAQSAASGLPVFNAGGGVHSVGAGTQLRYEWTPQWATHVFVEYEYLTGDAGDSPLVRLRGSRDQLTAGLGVTYSFDLITNR